MGDEYQDEAKAKFEFEVMKAGQELRSHAVHLSIDMFANALIRTTETDSRSVIDAAKIIYEFLLRGE